MIRKIPLHWQIFASILFAILFGIVFSTRYKLTEKDLNNLKEKINKESVISNISVINDIEFKTQSNFDEELKKLLSEDDYRTYRNTIIIQAYYNPQLKWIDWLGIVFLRALKMLVIPLIITSVVSGIVNIGSGSNLGRLGLKTILYYVSTSLAAILTGLFFIDIIQPGRDVDLGHFENLDTLAFQHKSLRDLLIEIVPDNIFQSVAGNDLLAILFVSMLTGIFITRMNKENSLFIKNLFQSLFELVMKITMFIITLAPLGIFGLVAKVISDQDNIGGLFKNLGGFVFCVVAALVVHAAFTLPLLMRIVGKVNPLRHFRNMASSLLTAFSTASSAAALPLTMSNVKENSGVSEKIANFTLPIGATVNMDGTAIYISAVVMFIAQAKGMVMGPKEQLIILLTALLTSIGTAAIPMASLVILTIILDIFGLPFALIALILPVDRILDMCRTSVNVWSDSCGAVIIAKSEGEKLTI